MNLKGSFSDYTPIFDSRRAVSQLIVKYIQSQSPKTEIDSTFGPLFAKVAVFIAGTIKFAISPATRTISNKMVDTPPPNLLPHDSLIDVMRG